jgi:hypothetical protein
VGAHEDAARVGRRIDRERTERWIHRSPLVRASCAALLYGFKSVISPSASIARQWTQS